MKFYLSTSENGYEASPFAIYVGGVYCGYRDDDTVPFIITMDGRVCFGAPGSEHHEILAHIGEKQSKAEGRFWRGSNALAFWEENIDITGENVRLVVGALQKRLGVNPDNIHMFLDCGYDSSDRSGSLLIVELTPAEYLSMNIPARQNRQYLWSLYKKKNKLSNSEKSGTAQNGMYSRDVWRHYQNVNEGRGRKIVISESKLRKIIASVIEEHLNERGTNLSSLYHFTTIDGLDGIIRSWDFRLSGYQKDIRGGKNYMSFTRHKTPLEGYAAVNETPVRIEVSPDVLNSMHGTSIDSYEYYSPVNAKISSRCNPWSNIYQGDGEESAKAAYRKANANSKKTYDYGGSEFLNQAEECLTSDASSIYAEQAIKRIDVCAARCFNKSFSNSYKKEIYHAFSNILRSVNSPLYKKIFIYDNMRDFSLQTDNCIPISEYSEEALRADLGMNDITRRTVAESI